MNQMKIKVVMSCVVVTLFFLFTNLTKRENRLKMYNKKLLKAVKDVQNRQKQRKLLIASVCNTSYAQRDELTKDVLNSIHSHLDHFIFDDKHKLIYCFVPKVASTNWKRVLLTIDGGFQHFSELNPLLIKGNVSQARSVFKTLDQIEDIDEVIKRLKHYMKFVFVRNPFERLLSAFRNKFEFAYNDYFRERFGRKIINKYRNISSKASLNAGNDVTFQEFVNYVADLDSGNYKEAFNEHWRPISDLCFPCLVRFDVIGKYETLEEDAFLVLWKANLFNSVRFPQRNETYSSTPTSELITKYYTKLPQDLLTKILDLYENDLNLFNYEIKFS